MSRGNVIAWELALVLLLALVLTLEWWRAGELEDLSRRVDELETVPRRRAAPTKKKTDDAEVSK